MLRHNDNAKAFVNVMGFEVFWGETSVSCFFGSAGFAGSVTATSPKFCGREVSSAKAILLANEDRKKICL